MANNIENVIRWLEMNGLELWSVSRTRGENSKVFDSLDEETPIERKQRFRDTMALLPKTWYVVKAKKNKTDSRGGFETEFENVSGSAATPQESVAVSGMSSIDVEQKINAAIQAYKVAQEVEQLKRENKELKKELDENDNAVTRIITKAEPVIGMLMSRFIPEKPTVTLAGLERVASTQAENAEVEEITEDEQTRITTAVQKWADADTEFIEVLEFIAEFAAKNEPISVMPGMKLSYDQIKSMFLGK